MPDQQKEPGADSRILLTPTGQCATSDVGRIIEVTSVAVEARPWTAPVRHGLLLHNTAWGWLSRALDRAYEKCEKLQARTWVLGTINALANAADRMRVRGLRPYLYRAAKPGQHAFYRINGVASASEVLMEPFEPRLGDWLRLGKSLLPGPRRSE